MLHMDLSFKTLTYPALSSIFYFGISYILGMNRSVFNSLYKNNRHYKQIIRIVGAFYNLFMTCFSGFVFYHLAVSVIQEYGTLFNHDVWFEKRFTENVKILNIGWLFCHSKTVEYFDTFFVLLKGGRPIFLQKFHHFGAVWCWFLLVYVDSSAVIMTTLLNSFVHTLMYFYYFLSVFDEHKIISPIKPIMTFIQQLQLAYGFYTCLIGYFMRHCQGTLNDRYIFTAMIFLVYGLCLNLLFLQFSFVNYIKPKKKSVSKDL